MSMIVLVTDADRGAGLAIIQALATAVPSATLLLGARKLSEAKEAIESFKNAKINQLTIVTIQIDVTDDKAVRNAANEVSSKYGRLDVLVNNAGIVFFKKNNDDLRGTYNKILDTKVSSVALVSTIFAPLLVESNNPKVIQLSSSRASLSKSTTLEMPPSASLSSGSTKECLNEVTIALSKAYPNINFYAANPGHVKTEPKNYRGKKEPIDATTFVVKLVKEVHPFGFYEYENGVFDIVPW